MSKFKSQMSKLGSEKLFSKIFHSYYIFPLAFILAIIVSIGVASASPSGNNYFEILTNKPTGADNSGDGGTGNSADYNYYYVGQSFTGNISVKSTGTNAANLWIDYDTDKMHVSNLATGTYFPFWASQSVSGGRVKSTGYRVAGYSSGLGNFGSINVTATAPSEANYGINAPSRLTINVGTIGATTESNISHDGVDILGSKEDFQFHIWADTKKPYAKNPIPFNGASGISVESPFVFELRDSKNGEGDDSGVGTGVDLPPAPGNISANDGSGSIALNSYSSYFCSGIWGTNLCNVTVSPPSPLGISGDNRRWKYGTAYIVTVSGFRDRASSNQNQLEDDANGPNIMNPKTWSFTTESDTAKPQVLGESPARGSGSIGVAASISVDVGDKKSYPGDVSGSGVDSTSCKINISSPSHILTTYQQGVAGLSVTPIDFGYRYTITPSQSFAQSETVSVVVYDCTDNSGNVMVADNYTFSTADTAAPYVDSISPANDSNIAANGIISFHIKDDGAGVDLANTVIYINGNYYTNSGGAGSVTATGTRITYANSFNFNGGNYSGDPTNVSADIHDRVFTIKPSMDFTAGEAVPVIIYTKDVSGNIMEGLAYALTVTGAPICSGQGFCGANTTWDGTKCVGKSGGGNLYSPSCPGQDNSSPQINSSSVQIVQIDEHSVLIDFFSNINGNAWIVYGKSSSKNGNSPPNYGYQFNSGSDSSGSTHHSIAIKNLDSGQLYYFAPVFERDGKTVRSDELMFTPRFAFQTITKENICTPQILQPVSDKLIIRETVREVPQNCPVSPGTSSGATNPGFSFGIEKTVQGNEPVGSGDATVFSFPPGNDNKNLNFSGKTIPFGNIAITIY